jgi:predicted transcriptional regulator
VTDECSSRWTIFTNHGHVLICVASSPDMKFHEIAAAVGITERTTLTILADLEQPGYIERRRLGRRSRYTISRQAPLRHPMEEETTIGAIVDAVKVAYTHQAADETPGRRLVF